MQHNVTTVVCGNTNCYIVSSGNGYILIDAGISTHGDNFIKKLTEEGFLPDKIKLLILTHGHYDHVGNAAILRDKYGIKIAMHKDDINLVKNGINEFPKARTLFGAMIREISMSGFRMIKWTTFEPDILLDDGESLQKYNFDANVIHLPGHTEGSIGILTSGGMLFAGDLVMNIGRPSLSIFANDFELLNKNFDSLKQYDMQNIYPGHGNPFSAEALF